MTKQQQQDIPAVGEGEIARRRGGVVVLRPTPMRVRFALEEALAADHHGVQAVLSCAVRALPESAERQMLIETLLCAGDVCRGEDVARHFTPALRDAARRVVVAEGAEHWLGEGGRLALLDALRRAGEAVAFGAGLELLPPFQLEVDSPSLRRTQAERARREAAEREAVERLSHLKRSAEVLKAFQEMRESAPDVPTGEFLARLSEGDRPQVMGALLAAGAKQAAAGPLLAVGGAKLVRVDGAETRVIPIDGEVGPFRSVQEVEVGGARALAIGGRGGVVVVDPTLPGAGEVYRAPGVASELGFNCVVTWDGRLWASHSEAGLVGWELHRGEAPTVTISPGEMGAAGGARNLVVVGGRLLLSAANRLFVMDPASSPAAVAATSSVPILALLPVSGGVLVVRANGEIERLSQEDLAAVRRLPAVGNVTAACLLPFFDSPRVLLATEEAGAILCVSTEDTLVTRYHSPYRGMRALAASAGAIAGLSPDRQRVVLFNPDSPEPTRDLHLTPLLKHRLADVCFAGA